MNNLQITGISTEVETINMDNEIVDMSIRGYNVSIKVGELYTTLFLDAYDMEKLASVEELKERAVKYVNQFMKEDYR